MINLLTTRIDERTTPQQMEEIRRNIYDAIRELQLSPGARATIIKDVTLEDGKETTVPHGLGRRVTVWPTAIRGASTVGMIQEIRDLTGVRREDYVVLKASGYGATITVDLEVK